MADGNSLLSFIARRHSVGLEDVATDALYFILCRSDSSRRALPDFLGDDGGPLEIAAVQPWLVDAHGGIPDLACLDEDENVVAFIESKFWAGLTDHQPVTYWERLPADRPSTLLFLAPDDRIEPDSLWVELVDRLCNAGHEFGPEDRRKSHVTAQGKAGQRRLTLTSWRLPLDHMAQQSKRDGDEQAGFEIAQLQGLAADVIAGDKPQRDDNLRKLVDEAVKRVEQSGWANTDGLTLGRGYEYFARYFRIAGASAGLRVDYKANKEMPGKILWLWFYPDPDASVGFEEVRSSLGSEAECGLEWLPGQVCTPVALPADADRGATLSAIIAELERIAELIDPNGPTYR